MLLLGIFLNAALIFSVPISTIPFGLRTLMPAVTEPHAYQSPSHLNLTTPSLITDPTTYKPVCLRTLKSIDHTTLAQDCSYILNEVILRLDGVFEKRAFLNRGYLDSQGHHVSARWAHGQCIIYVGAARSESVGWFTLFEVALTANKILSDCVLSDINAKGGLMSIGLREESFYVDLQEGYMNDVNMDDGSDAELSIPTIFEVSKPTLNAKRAARGMTGSQKRRLDPRGLLWPMNNSVPSSTLRHPATRLGDEPACFPPESRLPNTVADDCNFIINNVILAMNDPFEEKSWGYRDGVDINLSLAENHWRFGGCYIVVRNTHEGMVDYFRPVDVAVLAQSIVQKCVIETKIPLGGFADIGHLILDHSFFVVVSGNRYGGQSLRNSTTLSLPSGELHTLGRRASLSPGQERIISSVVTEGFKAGERYPVRCLDPDEPIPGHHQLKLAVISDCSFIIFDMILRLPNPMLEQTFGFTDADDVNLSNERNAVWVYRSCAVYLTASDKTSRDRFRFVDVALAAQRTLDECVQEPEYTLGGFTDVGTVENKFYIGIGGLEQADVGNGTSLVLMSDTIVPATRPALKSSNTHRDTESTELHKRSSQTTEFSQATIQLAPPVRCLRSGMHGARKIETQDCTKAAMVLLHDPKVLVPQLFTTEPTGGIRMPFVQHNASCYFMMDTNSDLSMTDAIPLLQIVYWALEIILKCVSGRDVGFGGVSKLDADKDIYVSVTGMDPRDIENGLASLWDEDALGVRLGNQSLQLVDVGQS